MPGTTGASERGWVPALSAAGAPASRAFRCGIRKGAHSPLRGLSGVSLAPPGPRVPARSPRPAGVAGAGTGRGRRQGGTWKNHPDCIAVGEAAGGAGSPEPPARGAFLRARFPGARPCGARGLVRGPRAAAAGAGGTTSPPHTHTGRETVAEKMLQLLRQSCPTRPFRPLVSGSGECVLGKRKLDYLGVCRGSAALGALGSNLRANPFSQKPCLLPLEGS